MELLGLKSSGASKIISNMVQADVIEPVSGHGKGKYKFKELLSILDLKASEHPVPFFKIQEPFYRPATHIV